MKAGRKSVTIEWEVTDAHTLRATIDRSVLEADADAAQAVRRYAGWDGRDSDEHAAREDERRDLITVYEWLEHTLEDALQASAHALARTLVLHEGEGAGTDMFVQQPEQAAQLTGGDGYRGQDHATEVWERMTRERGRLGASAREAALKGAKYALGSELDDWLEGEGQGIWMLAEMLE